MSIVNPLKLDELTIKEGARKFLDFHKKECDLSDDFTIDEIHRQLVLSPSTYAMLYEVTTNGQKRKIRVNASAESARQNAFKYIKFLEKFFNGPKYFLPKTYCYDTSYNAIVYENIKGWLLIDRLAEAQSLDVPIALAGQWLKNLHSIRDFSGLGGSKLPGQCIIHGDFQPTNIVIEENEITVFDFNDSRIDDPMIDVAWFLNQLKVMMLRFNDIEKYKNLKTIFIDNYQLGFDEEKFKTYSKENFVKIYQTLTQSIDESEKHILEKIKVLI